MERRVNQCSSGREGGLWRRILGREVEMMEAERERGGEVVVGTERLREGEVVDESAVPGGALAGVVLGRREEDSGRVEGLYQGTSRLRADLLRERERMSTSAMEPSAFLVEDLWKLVESCCFERKARPSVRRVVMKGRRSGWSGCSVGLALDLGSESGRSGCGGISEISSGVSRRSGENPGWY